MIRSTRSVVRLAVLCLGLCQLANQPATAAEYVHAESPAPSSAENVLGPFGWSFRARPIPERSVWTGAKASLEDTPPFFRDTQFSYEFRTYSFDRRNTTTDLREAWAIGGQLAYTSGWWNNIGVRVAYYNSTEIDSDGGDTGLLAPGQKNISIIGEANLRYRFTNGILADSVIQLYRQALDMPYVNQRDIRMLPSTHEGLTIRRVGSSLDYGFGHLTKFKKYDSNDFIYMSEAAGAEGTNKGATLGGLRYPIGNDFSVGAGTLYGWDTFNTFFAEATYNRMLKGELDFRLSGQFTDQRSVGDELVGDFDTRHFAARAAFGWRGAIVKLAGSVTADDAGIRKPWGGSPSYLSIQKLNFDRANEKAVLLGLSYNTEFFSTLGLSGFINIAHGTDAENPLTGEGLPDQTEYDLTVDYKPPRGLLQGLWVRARYARVDIEGDGERVRDIRIIVNYSIPFL